FGKIMSISDELMLRYYELLTDEALPPLRAALAAGTAHPMDAKKRLGELLVTRFHGADAAAAAARAFEERFQQRHLETSALAAVDEGCVLASDGRTCRLGVLDNAQLVKSNSEPRRLLKQRAVRIDGATVEGEDYPCSSAQLLVLEVGKRRAVRVRVR